MVTPDHLPSDFGEFSQDDEDGYAWDFDRGGDLGNYDEEEGE